MSFLRSENAIDELPSSVRPGFTFVSPTRGKIRMPEVEGFFHYFGESFANQFPYWEWVSQLLGKSPSGEEKAEELSARPAVFRENGSREE
jgi:hypothetical protein